MDAVSYKWLPKDRLRHQQLECLPLSKSEPEAAPVICSDQQDELEAISYEPQRKPPETSLTLPVLLRNPAITTIK